MNPLIALMIAPLLIWAGVFAFLWIVDGRVRALERKLEASRLTTDPAASYRADDVTQKETIAR